VVSGIVQDPSGAVIPKAAILLQPTAPNSPPARTTSDSIGNFRFADVSPGPYSLMISAPGFKQTIVAVTVTAKRPVPIRITLALAAHSESVTVGASDTVPQVSTETSENQSANTFDRNALDRVPVFDQDYITTLSRFLDDNATSTNGVSLIVNGIEANGPGVTPSAIQDVRINQNPTPCFSRIRDARVLKSQPSLELRISMAPSISSIATPSSTPVNAFAVQKPSESRQYYEGSLSGPLSHDKKPRSFYLSIAILIPCRPSLTQKNQFGPVHENVSCSHPSFFCRGPRLSRARQWRPVLDRATPTKILLRKSKTSVATSSPKPGTTPQ